MNHHLISPSKFNCPVSIFAIFVFHKKRLLNQKKDKSALKVNAGIEQPASVNPALRKGLKQFKKPLSNVDDYLEGITQGNRAVLSQAITLIESVRPEDRELAGKLIQRCLPYSGKSVRLGITGVPGVGKSTFIEAFGLHLISKGHQVAVLAIDPSSTRTKGSILGDKTRMEQLSSHPKAFIRPSASAGTLGGIARQTRESILLCEAAGFDRIFVETVGVGQSETAVSKIVDFFLLLMLAGGGDELQGIKRGIMEMADLIVIHKADGDNIRPSQLTKQAYENALHLFPKLTNGWQPKVMTASSVTGQGIAEIDQQIEQFLELTRSNGFFEKNRQQQALSIMEESIEEAIHSHFFQQKEIQEQLKSYRNQILEGKISPYEVAGKLFDFYLKTLSQL
jgi:LAO/AO transport system kinase